MDEKLFVWPEELTIKMLELRFQYDKVFKSKKQPWMAFYKILLKHGFPRDVTKTQVQKKWGYVFDMYKIAKRENNTSWKYFEIFENHYGKNVEIGKYESWPNEWRLKLITCISTAKEHKMDQKTMWRTVERAMRSQDMPEDCCVQDFQGLWHHLRVTFLRKHRIVSRKGVDESKWPLYDAMLEYYKMYESMEAINGEDLPHVVRRKAKNRSRRNVDNNDNEQDFSWSRDITESFVQLRLQNDCLFKERPQAWKDFVTMLKNEYGFPSNLTQISACKKWASTYMAYQKAKATKNTSWLYYNLFEAYLGEGSLSLNPLFDWHESWVLKLIEARTDLEDIFVHKDYRKFTYKCWREVEKRLRREGIPLDHSLLDLHHIWIYLNKTYKWKKKYANKGVLKEQWTYYDAMTKYVEVHEKLSATMNDKLSPEFDSQDVEEFGNVDFDEDDDMKLFDLKQKMESKNSKPENDLRSKQCRACANVGSCVDIFEQHVDNYDAATVFILVTGVQVQKSEQLPTQICYDCLQELENAYKFRQKCQEVDKQFRESNNIKIEILEGLGEHLGEVLHDDNDTHDDVEYMNAIHDSSVNCHSLDNVINNDITQEKTNLVKKLRRKPLKKEPGKRRYDYWKVCEICGKNTRDLKSHIDTHNMGKPYSCDVCGKQFKFRNGLITHKGTHSGVPKKTCEICGKAFHVLAHFKRHYTIHANERKFACDTCGQRFNSLDILRVHIRIHTGERPFDCSECGKSFRTAGCVSRHKRIVHRITRKQ